MYPGPSLHSSFKEVLLHVPSFGKRSYYRLHGTQKSFATLAPVGAEARSGAPKSTKTMTNLLSLV
jgi:hypothetical protein